MYSIENKKYPCSTSVTMKYIGGKWKAVILIHLIKGKKRYSELNKEISMITERTLSLQLKELEADGLISRTVKTKKPPLVVEYQLTDFGETLIPILMDLASWGKEVAASQKKVKVLA